MALSGGLGAGVVHRELHHAMAVWTPNSNGGGHRRARDQSREEERGDLLDTDPNRRLGQMEGESVLHLEAVERDGRGDPDHRRQGEPEAKKKRGDGRVEAAEEEILEEGAWPGV